MWGPRVLKALLKSGWPKNCVMNVNFPDRLPQDVAGVEVTSQGFRDEAISTLEKRTDLRGADYFWIGYSSKPSKPDEERTCVRSMRAGVGDAAAYRHDAPCVSGGAGQVIQSG